MGIDRTEAKRRGQSKQQGKTKHPFVMLEHRIIHSAAHADLKMSSRALLVLLATQFNGTNNGHLQATLSWLKPYGFGSQHTVSAAIADLIAHGFIYRTLSSGANHQSARYAITWQPIHQKDGLFLGGYRANAWRDWEPKKSS